MGGPEHSRSGECHRKPVATEQPLSRCEKISTNFRSRKCVLEVVKHRREKMGRIRRNRLDKLRDTPASGGLQIYERRGV